MKKIELVKVPEWYSGYIKAVPDMELLDALGHSDSVFSELIENITEEDSNFAYDVGKWSIKDLILHISDAERIFSYRALRIARGDQTVLSGYDHNEFVETAQAEKRNKVDLLNEYQLLRKSTLAMFSTFSNSSLKLEGKVDENVFSAGMLGFIIVGHQLHHASIIKARYLSKLRS